MEGNYIRCLEIMFWWKSKELVKFNVMEYDVYSNKVTLFTDIMYMHDHIDIECTMFFVIHDAPF